MASEINVGSSFNNQATMDLPQQAQLRTESFGARLRRLRRSRRLNQAELSSALNVSAPAISG
ncbi:hypothetical protein [Sphingopyxis sp.]|uniref:hypothetical protein n=1 Tax=Sphingopyxis sp. TaxID=1908224 RepID=UPI001D310BD8|nr:hypothetical protein [Sphingopyxis sp.]MBW8295876.1 hypothetical protein [Sphingopyxis sp.]